MAGNDIHVPKLPGVKKLSDHDTSDGDLGVTFNPIPGKKGMHEPEPVSKTAPSDSILSNHDDVFDVGHAFGTKGLDAGTIVTDRKKRTASFTGILSEAFDEWWGKTSTKLDRVVEKLETLKPEEPPLIETPEKRKEVILEAAQHTKQAPRDDHHIVVEKIKTMTQDAQKVTGKPYFIKPAQTIPQTPSWTHTIDDGKAADTMRDALPQNLPTLDLRDVTVAPSIESRTIGYGNATSIHHDNADAFTFTPPPKRETPVKADGPRIAPEIKRHADLRPVLKASAANTSLRPSLKIPQPTAVRTEPPPQPRHEVPPEKTPFAPPPPRREPPPVPVAPPAIRKMPVSTVPEPSAVASTLPSTHARPSLREELVNDIRLPKLALPSFTFLNTTTVLSVVIVGALLGVIAGIYSATQLLSVDTPPEMAPITLSGFTINAEPLPITETLSRQVLLAGFAEKIRSAPNGMMQYYPVRETSRGPEALTAAELMPLLAPRAPASLVRQVDQVVMVGSVTTQKNEPFLIVKADTFDSGFAGMLAWEPYLSEDLAPLFGTPVTASRTPGTPESTPPRFSDVLKDNRSIRILYGEEGEERLIYAFLNRTLIVITTSTEALSALISGLK